MFGIRTRVAVLLTVLGSVVLPGSANAQAVGTWVSGVGDDANPCSRTAPCKTFAGAISKTAAGGVIRVLDPGAFGTVTITKSITIEATGSLADVLAAGTNGIVVNAAGTDAIVLRGINLRGVGNGLNGIRFLAGGSLVVEQVEIEGFSQSGIDFTPSANARLLVAESTIRRNAGPGIRLNPSAGAATATVIQSTIVGSSSGVSVTGSSRLVLSESTVTMNGVGIAAASSSLAVVDLEDCSVSFNDTGIRSGAGGIVRLSNVDLLENGTGIDSSDGGTVSTWGNNRSGGNAVPGAPTEPPTTLITMMLPLP